MPFARAAFSIAAYCSFVTSFEMSASRPASMSSARWPSTVIGVSDRRSLISSTERPDWKSANVTSTVGSAGSARFRGACSGRAAPLSPRSWRARSTRAGSRPRITSPPAGVR